MASASARAPSCRSRMAAITAAPSASFPSGAAIRARCRRAKWSSRCAASSPMAIARSCSTGVDITSWGADLPGKPKLGNLVRADAQARAGAARACGCRRSIRSRRTTTLLSAFAEEERLMPHLHLSLQSGDDMILKRMKRRHSRADSIALLRRGCGGCGPTSSSAPISSPAFRPRPKRCSTIRSRSSMNATSPISMSFPFSAAAGHAGGAHAAARRRNDRAARRRVARAGRGRARAAS